jgi:DNA-directed RNA polymerases I and III subunit RPAC1
MVARGEYVVKEDGLQFEHNPDVEQDQPCSPNDFLLRFRWVQMLKIVVVVACFTDPSMLLLAFYNRRSNFEMNILEQPDENTLVFEMIHCDVSFANALRRILLAEVPTVALEHVYMWNNNSIIHDEVLAHRLGLIPLNIDARYLEDVDEVADYNDNAEFVPTDRNTVVFRLDVACTNAPPKPAKTKSKRSQNATTPEELDDAVVQSHAELEAVAATATTSQQRSPLQYPPDRPYTKHVYAADLVWIPQGDQAETFPPHTLATSPALHPDILIAKLRPGQAIELEAHARRGIGKDHAKFSPVATASYRLMPKIELLRPVYDDLARELVHLYEPGVFDLVDVSTDDSNTAPPGTQVQARLCNPYACTMSRNYMRDPVLKESIRMSRIADHFIFSVESVGAYPPGVLVAEALRVLQRKCLRVMDLVDESTLRSSSTATSSEWP